jgi:hypothetical protein
MNSNLDAQITNFMNYLSGQATSLNNDFTASKDAKARKLRVKQMKLMNDVCEKLLEVKNVMKDLIDLDKKNNIL